MSRSRNSTCSKPKCGVCAPHKHVKHQLSRLAKLPLRDRRKLGKKNNQGVTW